MKRILLALMLAATPAMAQQAPTADLRLQVLAYDPGQVVRLKAVPNYQMTILFNARETVENVAIGDSEAWQTTLNNRGDALFLKPLRSNGVTNMTVITDARVYNFELSAAYGAAGDTPFTVRFTYPEDAARATAVAETQAAVEPGQYRVSGARALRPSVISDDGRSTFIEWRKDQAFPAVFALDRDGKEILLDGQVRDGRYVVDAVHEALLFRLENQTARAQRQRLRGRR